MTDNGWQDAAVDLDYALHLLLTAKTLPGIGDAASRVANARYAFRTWLDGYDPDTGTLPWERDEA